jgi:hypothetical protein
MSVGIFKSDKLIGLFANSYTSHLHAQHQTLKSFKQWKKTGSASGLNAEGTLSCVYLLGPLVVVVITLEDSIALNKLYYTRVERILKQADLKLTMETRMLIDEVMSKETPPKQPFINLNKPAVKDSDWHGEEEEVSALFDSIKIKKKETEILDFIFSKLRFDFLKEENIGELPSLQPAMSRSMESKTYEQFLVNLNVWDNQKSKEVANSKLSLNFKGQQHNPFDNIQSIASPTISAKRVPTTPAAKAALLLEEKLIIKITETVINEKFINGKLLISNFEANKLYSITPRSKLWIESTYIDKRKFSGVANLQHMETEGEIRILIPKDTGAVLPVYEYVINPSLVNNETIPFFIAYIKKQAKLFLKITINKKFQSSFAAFDLKVDLSNMTDEHLIESSHPGHSRNSTYHISFDPSEIRKESVIVKLDLHDESAGFEKVTAISQIDRSFLDLEFNLKSGVYENNARLASTLEVEYTLMV